MNNTAISTASLTDALGRLSKNRFHILDLVSPTPEKVLRGFAATVRYVPLRDDIFDGEIHTFGHFFAEATPADATDTVLVLGGSDSDVSVGGSTKFSRLQNRGLAGLLTNSRIRDFAELAEYDPVFYSSGQSVKTGSGTVMPVASGEPVSLGDVTVYPGDYIQADSTGAVVIPPMLFDEVFRVAKVIDETEAEALESIRSE